jgi:protein-S-isoprenylcysteine O-methyltransferase Ste14
VPALALVFLALYGLLALGLRMLIQLRRTGSTGFKGVSGAPGSVEWVAGSLLVAAIALCVAGPLLELLDAVGPLGPLAGDAGVVIGAALAALGIALTIAAQLAMGEAWRIGVDPDERTELVTAGPFAIVRNPIYAAMIPAFVGIALLAPNPLTIAGALGVIAALELQTRSVEEPYLLRTHGDRYAAYAARVGRFLPGIGRLRGDGRGADPS